MQIEAHALSEENVARLVERLRAEEERMVKLHDLVVAQRDKQHSGAAFADINSIKHAVSGRDPVLAEAADALAALAALSARATAAEAARDEAVRAETERCAKIAEGWGVWAFKPGGVYDQEDIDIIAGTIGPNIAAAIRANTGGQSDAS